MNKKIFGTSMAILIVLAASATFAQEPTARPSRSKLDSIAGLELVNTKAEVVTYGGRKAIHLETMTDEQLTASGAKSNETLAILKGTQFKNGTIEVDVLGKAKTQLDDTARGFIGIAFRVQGEGKYECFYLRPTNGRADDQLRRNHSAQYISTPDWPWFRLRKENPGVYESYVDLEPDKWVRMRVVVSGTKAQLYVNGSAQPVLIVNDLKLGESSGAIALWTTTVTDGYFSNLTVK